MEIEVHTLRSNRLNTLTTGLALLITFTLLLGYQFFSGRQQLVEELNTQAAIIGANSSAALAFNDAKAAQEILDAIRLAPRILGGALYRYDGSLLASVNDPEGILPTSIDPKALRQSTIHTPQPGSTRDLLRHEIIQERTHVGTLLLDVSYASLYLKMLEYAVGLTFIGSIALLLTQRFTAGLRKKMALTEEQLEQMALYDSITGLPNRRLFEKELQKAIDRAKRDGRSAALLFIDVDDFKKVNDICGHEAGDQVLLMISERLKKTIRAIDIISRVGGDEFAAILSGIGAPENAAKIAEDMIGVIAAPFPTSPIPSHIGLSIGMTMIPVDSDDPSTLMRWSDMAMYEAKSLGKNRYQFFSTRINEKVHGELQLEASLRRSLKTHRSGLRVVYQPQVCAKTRKLLGVEALMRWQDEGGRIISPGEFIPIAEKTGLICDLGANLVIRICEDLAIIRAGGLVIPNVAINVSPRELRQGSVMVDNICQTLRNFNECREHFQFELTENALMDDRGTEVLDAFTQAGFSLAIDDFGAGYSSLGYLKRFKVNTLKIDRQFIEHLPADEEDAAIVKAVVQMSRALGITVVAEGVETEAQANFLSANGCDILQGFLISRPMSPELLMTFIRSLDARSPDA